MEDMSFDAVVVSVFGRGHWIASELAREKMKVLLIDLSSKMGPWPAEDGEGPFGVFRLERYSESFTERWINDDPVATVDNGWTLWLDRGPFEFKGPLTRHHFQTQGWPEKWSELFQKGESLGAEKVRAGETWDFSKRWLPALAAQAGATRSRLSAKALEGGRPLPIMANFSVRWSTRQGLRKNLDWLVSKGVRTTQQSEILDLAFRSRRELSGLELSGELSGLLRFQRLVWTLGADETAFLSRTLFEKLYPGGRAEADWCWLRFRLQMKESPELSVLPLHAVLIRDIDSPWTHQNLIVLQRTPAARQFDAWMKLPSGQRYHKSYLEEHGRRLLVELGRKLPGGEPEILDLPQEARYTSTDLAGPRFPVWGEGQDPVKGRARFVNVDFESAENRENHSLDCEFDHQKRLIEKLLLWRKNQLAQKKKEAEA